MCIVGDFLWFLFLCLIGACLSFGFGVVECTSGCGFESRVDGGLGADLPVWVCIRLVYFVC